ncbi:MAG: hypothetical protein ACRCX8_11160 [Sarcina sp.]
MSIIETTVSEDRIVVSVSKELILNVFNNMNVEYYNIPEENAELFFNDIAEGLKESLQDDGYWEQIFDSNVYEQDYVEHVD